MTPAALLLVILAATPAAEPADPEQLLRGGLRQLHELDHEAARRSFRALQRLQPDRPEGYLYEAVTLWLQDLERRHDLDVTRYIDTRHFAEEDSRARDADVERRLRKLLDHAVQVGEKRLAEKPDDVDTLYLLGTAHAVSAGFYVTVGHDASAALAAAREAHRAQTRVIELDPERWDAYLQIGLYEYVTGSLPFYLKWIARVAGYRGDRERGIEQIEQAASKGDLARRDAQVMLSVIYVRDERFEEALTLLQELTATSRHNHVLRLNQAFVEMCLGRYHEAAHSYADATAVALAGARLDHAAIRVREARALALAGETATALEAARELLADVGLDDRVRAEARLVEGLCLDSLQRRDEAVRAYLEVFRDEAAPKELRREAERYLQRAFVAPVFGAASR